MTPWGTDLLEKLIIAQLFKNISIFYGTRRCLDYWSLPWARLIQIIPNYFKFPFNNIPSTLSSSKLSLPCRFSGWSFACTFRVSHACYIHCPSHCSWFDHFNKIWWRVLRQCQQNIEKLSVNEWKKFGSKPTTSLTAFFRNVCKSRRSRYLLCSYE